MEINTSKHNWASKFYESHNRVGRGHRWRCGCEGIKCPAARNKKARTRPHTNSVFHAALLLFSRPIIPVIPPNSKHDLLRERLTAPAPVECGVVILPDKARPAS